MDRTQSCEDCNPGSTPGQGNLGRLAEWSKAHVWSTCIRATVSRVRIPNLPYSKTKNEKKNLISFFYFINDNDAFTYKIKKSASAFAFFLHDDLDRSYQD